MLTCKFLGINGFEFTKEGKTLLVDPYVSRTPADAGSVCRPQVVRKHIKKADYIVLGHSHYDHLGDVHEIASYTEAVICGSETTLNICRHFGISEERLIRFETRTGIELGPFNVTPIPSRHKEPMLSPGEYTSIPEQVAVEGDYPEGGTWALYIDTVEASFVNLGSADCIEAELSGLTCDYLLIGIAGRKPDFIPRVLSSLSSGTVIPTHWDLFRHNPVENAGEKYSTKEFAEEVRVTKPDQNIKVLGVLETLSL